MVEELLTAVISPPAKHERGTLFALDRVLRGCARHRDYHNRDSARAANDLSVQHP
jgi:hypothetical protein